MPAMTDPSDALRSFQEAVKTGVLALRPCELDPTLSLHVDEPNGVLRLTYAYVEGRQVTALAMFVQSDPYEGFPCFQVGYAVPAEKQEQGRAKAIFKAAIAEMERGFARTPLRTFWIEAVVGLENHASRHIAATVLGDEGREVVDEFSGQPAMLYLRKVGGA